MNKGTKFETKYASTVRKGSAGICIEELDGRVHALKIHFDRTGEALWFMKRDLKKWRKNNMNNISLIGRLTKDVELRFTPSGVASAKFTLAVNRPFKDANGEQKADFIQIQVWRKQAENVANFIKKGSQVGITGRIQTGSYEGQDGKRIYTTDVVADSVQFLEPKSTQDSSQPSSGTNTNQYQQNAPQQSQQQYQAPTNNAEFDDSDLPF